MNRRGRRPSLLKSEAEKPLGGADPRPSGRSRERRPPARGEHREGRGGGQSSAAPSRRSDALPAPGTALQQPEPPPKRRGDRRDPSGLRSKD